MSKFFNSKEQAEIQRAKQRLREKEQRRIERAKFEEFAKEEIQRRADISAMAELLAAKVPSAIKKAEPTELQKTLSEMVDKMQPPLKEPKTELEVMVDKLMDKFELYRIKKESK